MRFGRKPGPDELKALERMRDGLPLDPRRCFVIDHGKHPVLTFFKRLVTGETILDLFRAVPPMVGRLFQLALSNWSKKPKPLEPMTFFLWHNNPTRRIVQAAKARILRTRETGNDNGIRVFALASPDDESKALAIIYRFTLPGTPVVEKAADAGAKPPK